MRFFLPLILLMATACTPTPAPKDAMARVNREFDGRDANTFFLDYGQPVSAKATGDGGKLYRWVSVEPGGGGGQAAYAVMYPGGHYGPIGGNGETFSGWCEISVLTDRDGKIKTLTLVGDSIGKYSGTRCAEIFSQAP